MEDIAESSSELSPINVVENGELEGNNVDENGLETIHEQEFYRDSARSASGVASGSINGDEKPELSDVFYMVCI